MSKDDFVSWVNKVWCHLNRTEGKLTLMDVDTEEYWQSDKLNELYQGVTGR